MLSLPLGLFVHQSDEPIMPTIASWCRAHVRAADPQCHLRL